MKDKPDSSCPKYTKKPSHIFIKKAHSLGQSYVCLGLIKPSLWTNIRKTLSPFEQLTHCPSLTVKIIFITTCSTKNRSLRLSCAGCSYIKISHNEQVTNLQVKTVNQHLCDAPDFDSRTNLQGQYLIYKTMQHYRISAQRSNSLNQHQQVVTKCKVYLGPAKYIPKCLSLKTSFFSNLMS